MFTGLIEEGGHIEDIRHGAQGITFRIKAQKILDDMAIGDSIAVDGVCLSVIEKGATGFTVQAVAETLTKSTLAGLRRGDEVNLERALRSADRLGGHFVQGHIDGIGEIIAIRKQGESATMRIKIPPRLVRYIGRKGSIAINGVSLTVAEIDHDKIEIALVPITLRDTNLNRMHPGSRVNIEVDILAKYVENLLHPNPTEDSDSLNGIKKWGYEH